jgi:hypothetical protein
MPRSTKAFTATKGVLHPFPEDILTSKIKNLSDFHASINILRGKAAKPLRANDLLEAPRRLQHQMDAAVCPAQRPVARQPVSK